MPRCSGFTWGASGRRSWRAASKLPRTANGLLGIGSEVELTAGDRARTYVVRGLLKDEGPARANDGSFALILIRPFSVTR